jgi:hypothetical protein
MLTPKQVNSGTNLKTKTEFVKSKYNFWKGNNLSVHTNISCKEAYIYKIIILYKSSLTDYSLYIETFFKNHLLFLQGLKLIMWWIKIYDSACIAIAWK